MKRILIALALALSAVSSFGTTLNPIQLLNPAGSTAGMVILSTGAATAPTWGSIALTNLPLAAANTVLGNGTASSAAVTALAVPSCSTSVSALNWTTSTGFTCNTSLITAATVSSTYAPLASPTFTGSPTVPGYLTTAVAASTYAPLASPTFTGTVTIPASASITTPNIVGTVGIAAASGSVGQHQTFGNAVGTISLPTSTATNCFSQSLTAGSYQLSGVINITAGAGNTISFPTGGISTTSASLGVFGTFTQTGATFGVASSIYMTLPTVYFDLTTTTTVYAVGSATNTGTGTCGANITILRIH